MSDYFGALMNSSGLAVAWRSSVPMPAAASAAEADIAPPHAEFHANVAHRARQDCADSYRPGGNRNYGR